MSIHRFPNDQDDPVKKIINDLKAQWKKTMNSGDGPSGPNLESAWLWGLAVLVLALVGVYTSFFRIEISEQGVVTRFGEYMRTVDSGLQFKLPYGIERVNVVPSRLTMQQEFGFRTTDSSGARTKYGDPDAQTKAESLMLTGDLNVVNVEWVVQYRIGDPWKYLFHVRDVERTIRDVSMSVVRRVVGDRLAGEVLTIARVEIAAEAKQITQEILDQYETGIIVEQVILQDVNPPDPVKPAFNEVNAAKQEQEQAINNAEREYNRVIPEARGKAEKLISDAEAYATEVVNKAKGDTAQFKSVLQEYRKAPRITRDRIYIETMEEIFAKTENFTVVDPAVKGLLPIFGKDAKNIGP